MITEKQVESVLQGLIAYQMQYVHFRLMGEYFGYPKCCVEAFLTEESDKDDSVSKFHGFLPCKECADKIRAGEITIESLIKDRHCPTPYPIDEDHDHRNKWQHEHLLKYIAKRVNEA